MPQDSPPFLSVQGCYVNGPPCLRLQALSLSGVHTCVAGISNASLQLPPSLSHRQSRLSDPAVGGAEGFAGHGTQGYLHLQGQRVFSAQESVRCSRSVRRGTVWDLCCKHGPQHPTGPPLTLTRHVSRLQDSVSALAPDCASKGNAKRAMFLCALSLKSFTPKLHMLWNVARLQTNLGRHPSTMLLSLHRVSAPPPLASMLRKPVGGFLTLGRGTVSLPRVKCHHAHLHDSHVW